jgi:hypothetical protein
MVKFSISPDTLLNYLTVLENNYQSVPYHNKIHAADVSQSIHVLLNSKVLEVSILFICIVLFIQVFLIEISFKSRYSRISKYLQQYFQPLFMTLIIQVLLINT